ncbi:STAS domain-containing protein [Undibacterium squillarum]|uniref:STAS domain-containing protein n=1 Tax=Undibacterium squillarum TaxID=1131567 RepID=A0ABQ2Y4I2_9BURK|nr:STAS domain-containing protein [Undibacterium squillarum]GGX52694.1 hypothetical protein GCM10010946_34230 [Undibacterium squillarum]
MYVVGNELSQANLMSALEAGLQAMRSGENIFDFSATEKADSAAVAAMVAWQREAGKLGVSLAFQAVPSTLQSLMALYGLSAHFTSSAPVPERH